MRAATPLLPRKRGPSPYSGPTLFEITTTASSQVVSFNIIAGSTPNLIVDWGDGSAEETFVSTGTKSHTYAVAGVRTMAMRGSCYGFNFYVTAGQAALTKLLSPIGQITGLATAANMFAYCTKLTEIPEGYFANCPAIVDFTQPFGWCTGITSIPDTLFCPNPTAAATTFANLFRGMTNLTGMIPGTLMKGQTQATSCSNWFNVGSTKMTGIGEGLFADCHKVTSFANCFCVNTGTGTGAFMTTNATMPATMFSKTPTAATTVYTDMFTGCSKLVGTVSSTFLENQTQATDLSQMFYATGVTGIGAGLLDDCVNATSVANMFRASKITNIPENLFAYCPKITAYNLCFYACTALTSLPASMFPATVTAVTINLQTMFTGCTNIASSIPATFFNSLANKVSSVYGLFQNCTQLDGNHYAFESWTTQPTLKTACYRGCTALDDIASIPADYL